jgi:hypothetical protein
MDVRQPRLVAHPQHPHGFDLPDHHGLPAPRELDGHAAIALAFGGHEIQHVRPLHSGHGGMWVRVEPRCGEPVIPACHAGRLAHSPSAVNRNVWW